MSKITGFDIGDPNKPFQVVGSHLGGRDRAITIERPRANIRGTEIEGLAKELSANTKAIREAIGRLEVMQGMMALDEETDSVVLDKKFVEDHEQEVAALKKLFEEIITKVQK